MSEPTQLWQLGAAAAARGLRAGDFSATELLENVLQRVDELNPQLNAIVEDRRDDGRARAAELDQRSAAGDWQGPLHGLPVTIKINVDLAGSATSNGLPALADAIAQEDSPIVSNLRRGGAVIFGRNNAPELSMRACTDNPLHGRPHNPPQHQHHVAADVVNFRPRRDRGGRQQGQQWQQRQHMVPLLSGEQFKHQPARNNPSQKKQSWPITLDPTQTHGI